MARAHGSTLAEQYKVSWAALLSRLAPILVLAFPPLAVGYLVYAGYNIVFLFGSIGALAIAGLIFAQPKATTLVILFVLYANLAVVAIRSHGVPEWMAASVFLLLVLPLLHYLIIDRQPIIVNQVFVLMVVYLGICLLSAVMSGHAERSVPRLLSYLLEGMVLYLLIINTVRTPAMMRNGLWVIIMAGVMMGSISLYQDLTGSYDNSFGGLAVVKETGTVNTGRVDALGNEIERHRLSGPLGSKNRYAQVMVVLLPIALTRIWAERSRLLRLVAAASCIPIVGGALLTFSRGAGISIVVTLIAMVFLRTIKVGQLLAILVAGSLVVAIAVPDYIYRISTAGEVAELASGNVEDTSGSIRGRATENLAALFIFLDHPFIGVGPGQTNDYTTEYGNEVGFRRLSGTRRAHNMFLEELGDTGIIGFTIFMVIVMLTLHQLAGVRRRWGDSRPDIAFTAAGLSLAVIAFLVSGVFLHLSYIRYYWLILALAGAAVQIYSSEQPSQATTAVGGPASAGLSLPNSVPGLISGARKPVAP